MADHKKLSLQLKTVSGSFIMLVVLFYDDTWYLLNVYVQSCGYYLQYILQLGCHTGPIQRCDH